MAVTRAVRCSRRATVARAAAGLACAAALCAAWVTLPARSQPIPAGASAAVLSFIDAAAGYVEIVRHWPQAPVDVDVYPFAPHFWGGCPGPGAIMTLLTAPPVSSPAAASAPSELERIRALSTHLAGVVSTAASGQPSGADQLRRLASGLRAPGDPTIEALKALVPLVADLGTYERRGYAVFAFIVWQGWRCGMTLRAVPEGYGIPFVR